MRFFYIPLLLQIYPARGVLGQDESNTVITYFSAETRASLSSGTHYAHIVLPDQPEVIALGPFGVPECDGDNKVILRTTFSASATSNDDVMFVYSNEQGYPPIHFGAAKPIMRRDTYLSEENSITAYCDNGSNNTPTTTSTSSLSSTWSTSDPTTPPSASVSPTQPQTGDTPTTSTGDSSGTASIPQDTDQSTGDPTPTTATSMDDGQNVPSVTSTISLPVSPTTSTIPMSSDTCTCHS